jgi:FKBP-type peptidyl-prolyl cis-trans isomerase FkpA
MRFLILGLLAASAVACGGSGIRELQVADTRPGTGVEARRGMTVSVHYTGWLYDPGAADQKGARFDSSRDSNEPFAFQLGAGDTIEGWERGVAGMKVGGTRTLVIPPALAYGEQGSPPAIPRNATLLFEIELLDARP